MNSPVTAALFAVALAGTAARPAIAASPDWPAPAASVDTLRDFMTQNVCLDRSGAVIIGRSPADGDPACVAQRDLRPGERLPYHKHDHPAPGQREAAPAGYQRHDSFPVETAELGTVVEHSFDFGAGEGRRFGVFDSGSDGGDIGVISQAGAAIGATEDAGGFRLWVGECKGPVAATALARSWIIARVDATGMLAGQTVAHLMEVPAGAQPICPSRFNLAYTSWRTGPFRYRSAAGQGAPITLLTLVSEHYGGADAAMADHVERFYFTRELGGTRWERWQNAGGNAQFSAGAIAEAAAQFARSGRCSAAEPPGSGGARGRAPMVLIDCREWTRIVPPDSAAGDPAGFFLEELRQRADIPRYFARPDGRN